MTTQTGRSVSISFLRAATSDLRSSRGKSGERTKLSSFSSDRPRSAQIRRAIDCSAGSPDSPGRKGARPGWGHGETAEERGAAGDRDQQVGGQRRFERLERAEDAAGLAGRQNAADEVAGFILPRIKLGGRKQPNLFFG